ncbi:MAG: Rhodanese domain-containing protein, partial [Candidatus Woesebacteria bacterium GW2011_GWC2_45_9]
ILIASFVFFTLVGFFAGRTPIKLATGEVISARELKKELVKKDFVFINVHTPYEGEIEKTDSFIQFDEMMASKQMLPQDKNTPIILYCKTGRMSAEALKTLKAIGYINVRHLDGGMDAWKRVGGNVF